MEIKKLQEKKIAILGFGKEGQSTLKFLQKQRIEDITILDKNHINISPFEKGSTAKQGGILTISGNTYLDTLQNFDIIFKSPGISPFGEKLKPYRDKFISQTQVFFENYSGKVIGITGTKGKSTISTLLYECLREAGYNVKLVGNIGNPVLDEIDIINKEVVYDYVIYEMSSYMLQDFVPQLHIGFFNNIYMCHLDWHYNSWNIYKEAKINILRNAEYKVVNGDFAMDHEIAGLEGKKILFNSKGKYITHDDTIYKEKLALISSCDIALQGEHNLKNISGVLAVLDIIIGDIEKIRDIFQKILPSFHGLPNRIEDIGIYEGIRFINDAIATTPESTIAAINTFDGQLQTLFLGGEDSGFEFQKIRKKILISSIQNIIAFPDTSEKIFPEIESRDYEKAFEIEIEGKTLQIIKTRTMKAGVDFAYKTTLPGKIALLSCAAPSFSLWKSYIEKADQFKKEVQQY